MGFKGKTLAVFGDSIMYGSGNDGFGVGEYLEKNLGFRILKYCVGGARVGYDEGKNWLIDQIKLAVTDKIKPDYIIFDGFTNDCFKTDGVNFDVPLGDYKKKIKDIFEIPKDGAEFTGCFEIAVAAFFKYFAPAKIMFVRPHKMGRREDEAQRIYGERAVDICKKHGVAVADIYKDSGLDTFDADMRDKYTCDSYGWGRGDCTHPNAACYEKFYLPIIEKKLKELT